MTYIGKNIRKIRGVKGLNQTDFADLFGLKRASVGAYEEGRAEPKIATLVEIANYFGMSLDDLVLKELSVNSLYKFDIFKDDLENAQSNNLNPVKSYVDLVEVPFVKLDNRDFYFDENSPSVNFSKISLPLIKGGEYLGLELERNEEGLLGVDSVLISILIAKRSRLKNHQDVQLNMVYLFELTDQFLLGKVNAKSISRIDVGYDSHFSYSKPLDPRSIKKIWEIENFVVIPTKFGKSYDSRLMQLENQLARLQNDFNSENE
ncbi:MAG: helix-turn-helix domain-containing protein [Flavobacteriales bacterium]|nr:helix-turn-helix domain-containing protein [Flavobacteriales bacterium]